MAQATSTHQPRFGPGWSYTGPITIAQVETIDTEDQAFAITGIRKNYLYAVYIESLDTGVIASGIGHGSDVNELTIRFSNPTAGNITPGALTLRVVGI